MGPENGRMSPSGITLTLTNLTTLRIFDEIQGWLIQWFLQVYFVEANAKQVHNYLSQLPIRVDNYQR
jgi:hypothetical protein